MWGGEVRRNKIVQPPLIKASRNAYDDRNECFLKILFASSRVIVVEKEEQTDPFQSFVAECGGCLGLFLGFSFLLVWDGLMQVVNIVKQCKYK